ncbi:M23 family metallopeptidase [Paraburkholderia acidipaludis]|uniref:M23 family metallopeptidase n=1 Tax=Paraburkholderia acidipaludis TaxID=660537 RepID=UPI0005B93323|nr:M23 family metallopeptidase [Paraburkholderia acidipaludis]
MIISPPFLPQLDPSKLDPAKSDPMMDAVDEFELFHGIYPIAFDRRRHCGIHLAPDMHGPVYAIADGEVVAYRVCQHAIDPDSSHVGFVLLKHMAETGDGRKLTFYSLYMHLLPLAEYHTFGYDAKGLADFLHMPTGDAQKGKVTQAVKGDGKKVRRKDILGYLGCYEGRTHLHFEIFMAPDDFAACFGHTQLGNPTPETPTGPDCWGNAYYMIPGKQTFYAQPPYTGTDNKLHGIEFKAGQEGENDLPLAVETYFCNGTKYTNVWSVAANGVRTLLTPEPVPEAGYEYDLYTRATALYAACPGDGYEMLRFGRVRSSTATPLTWAFVTYASGKQGYIDISNAAIKKLSDADFPAFMGWQKITDGNTPFDSNGMCDIDVLKKLVKDARPGNELPVIEDVTEAEKMQALSTYITLEKPVRQALRGFICYAPSEWDSTNNETRYAKLLDEGGFYHGREQGYQDFLKYLKEVQFWDVTGLPAGGNLWFFHPLAFIRHFRKCGWLSENELLSLLPTSAVRYAKPPHAPGYWTSEPIEITAAMKALVHKNYVSLNDAMCKFGITINPRRMAAFLANAAEETQWFTKLHESNPGAKYWPWDGRGFLQLTWPDNYVKYWEFFGRKIPDFLKKELSASAKMADKEGSSVSLQDNKHPALTAPMIQWREDMADGPVAPATSAGAYWAWMKAAIYADKAPIMQRQIQNITKPIFRSVIYYSCLSYGQVAATVNFGSAPKDTAKIARVNGILARYQAYTSALIILADGISFPTTSGQQMDRPDGFERRVM